MEVGSLMVLLISVELFDRSNATWKEAHTLENRWTKYAQDVLWQKSALIFEFPFRLFLEVMRWGKDDSTMVGFWNSSNYSHLQPIYLYTHAERLLIMMQWNLGFIRICLTWRKIRHRI
ncbi:MAG: hypothetical protein ACLTS6_11065 [Anaerobutyricum sp.]